MDMIASFSVQVRRLQVNELWRWYALIAATRLREHSYYFEIILEIKRA
jgi:hypothetical protein